MATGAKLLKFIWICHFVVFFMPFQTSSRLMHVQRALVSYFQLYTVNHKKLGHFYFYCNFGKCWSIFKILSLSESERNGS